MDSCARHDSRIGRALVSRMGDHGLQPIFVMCTYAHCTNNLDHAVCFVSTPITDRGLGREPSCSICEYEHTQTPAGSLVPLTDPSLWCVYIYTAPVIWIMQCALSPPLSQTEAWVGSLHVVSVNTSTLRHQQGASFR